MQDSLSFVTSSILKRAFNSLSLKPSTFFTLSNTVALSTTMVFSVYPPKLALCHFYYHFHLSLLVCTLTKQPLIQKCPTYCSQKKIAYSVSTIGKEVDGFSFTMQNFLLNKHSLQNFLSIQHCTALSKTMALLTTIIFFLHPPKLAFFLFYYHCHLIQFFFTLTR